MIFHTILNNLNTALGYKKQEGLCHGFSLRWLEANLLGEAELIKFEDRNDLITQTVTHTSVEELVRLINDSKTSSHFHSEADRRLLKSLQEIPSFLESINIFHAAANYRLFFNEPLTQQRIETLSLYASSDGILKLGGLASIYSEPFISNEKEIEQYLKNLEQLFKEVASLSSESLGILLSSHNHSISLSYNPSLGWQIRDINQQRSPPITAYYCAKKLMLGFQLCFQEDQTSPYLALNATIILTKNDLRIPILAKKLNSFKAMHQMNKEVALRSEMVNLVYIASKHGEAEIIAELAKYGADLNKATNEGHSPVYIAANLGNIEVIAELAKHGADLNEYELLLDVAAHKGNIPTLKQLLYFGLDFRKGPHLNSLIDNLHHPEIVKILKEHKKILHLLRLIEELDQYSNHLAKESDALSQEQGMQAAAFAEQLKEEATKFYKARLKNNTQECDEVRHQFTALFEQGNKIVTTHRAVWKPILINIAIAATAVGLIAIAINLLINNSFFFMKTQRQKQLELIKDNFFDVKQDLSTGF